MGRLSHLRDEGEATVSDTMAQVGRGQSGDCTKARESMGRAGVGTYSLQKLKLPKRTWSREGGNEEGLALLQNPPGWEVWRRVG